eukprot:TRINITY_DN27067_c0_g1_i1.p1 TRINITY_DN27067_c0_g1~~TRINITY_DN27067_c0_g1_i1.p1  ORF type:complete len:323 (-),score=44.24 TRINITY_DN27067_c0_g1_i1:25-993(-)
MFFARQAHLARLAPSLGDLMSLGFFVQAKADGLVVVTDIETQLPFEPLRALTPPKGSLSFLRKHAVSQIRYRDDRIIIDLCDGHICDGPVHQQMFSAHWGALGTTMPPFFYERYVLAFAEASKFLAQSGFAHALYVGGSLGMMKFNRLLPWDQGDVDFRVAASQGPGGCEAWLKLVKAWADGMGYRHPHVTGNGGSCKHYGVYALPDKSALNVDDPYSMGLVTFTDFAVKEIEPTLGFKAHGVHTRVHGELAGYLLKRYGPNAMRHKSKWEESIKCTVQKQYSHNCIGGHDGTHFQTCMEFTTFFDAGERRRLASGANHTFW